jgi:AcrR family transcriptional regulator
MGTTVKGVSERRTRVDGQASQRRILDAAAEIAGERGYEATSISLVSQRSGLPASSIYWHFEDKDDLIASVIDDSYHRWRASRGDPRAPGTAEDPDTAIATRLRETGESLAQFPDFVRLGLMLVLEHRPTEPTGRRKFVDIRTTVLRRIRDVFPLLYPDLDRGQVDSLARLSLALIDGYFIAAEAGEVDLTKAHTIIAQAVTSTARAISRKDGPSA